MTWTPKPVPGGSWNDEPVTSRTWPPAIIDGLLVIQFYGSDFIQFVNDAGEPIYFVADADTTWNDETTPADSWAPKPIPPAGWS